MLIKQFCESTGLPRDTVRFYVKRGLLTPDIGSRPGNQYQVFDDAQVERAKLIKTAQRLGFTLKQIAELGERYDAEDVGSQAKVAVLRAQIDGIAEQERELRQMRTYLSAKLSWVEDGELGSPPKFVENPFRTQAASARMLTTSLVKPRRISAGNRKVGRDQRDSLLTEAQ